MPGYYDWKIRNCPQSAIAKAESYLNTVEEIEPYLQEKWAAGGGTFAPGDVAVLAKSIQYVDAAEEHLETAKHVLASLFPGAPSVVGEATAEGGKVGVKKPTALFTTSRANQESYIVSALCEVAGANEKDGFLGWLAIMEDPIATLGYLLSFKLQVTPHLVEPGV